MRPLSPRNVRVANLAKLSRRRRARDDLDQFVIDGPVLVSDALRDRIEVLDVFVDAEHLDSLEIDRLIEEHPTLPFWLVEGGLSAHTDPVTSQGIAAVARRPRFDFLEAGNSSRSALVLALDAVGDPGNAGTLMRTAEAAGFDEVLLGAGSADVYAPKVIRASAGSVWRTRSRSGELPEEIERLKSVGVRVVGADGGAAAAPDEVDLRGAVVIVVGNETHGISSEVEALVDEWLAIPMQGNVESLNAAVAGSVVAFEAARQRRITKT